MTVTLRFEMYWIHPFTEVKESGIEGHGRFARQEIAEGELAMVVGGRAFDRRKEKWTTGVPVSEYVIIQASDNFIDNGVINHSCDPNLEISGDICFYALRSIPRGEELTVDYGTFLFGDDPRPFIENCKCGSTDCRGLVTGSDWMSADPKRLSGFLQRKLRR